MSTNLSPAFQGKAFKLLFNDGALRAVAQTAALLLPFFLVAGRALADGAVILSAILFLAHSLIEHDGKWLKEPWVRWTLVLWAWLLISSLANGFDPASLTRAASWVRFPVFTAAMAYWIADRKWFERFIVVCSLTLWFVAWDALAQYITMFDIFGYYALDNRLTGPFGKDKQVGIFITKLAFLPALPLLVGAVRSASQKKTLAAGIGFLLMALMVLLSGERMATLLFALGVFLSLLLLPSLRRYIAVLMFLTVLGGGTLLASRPALVERHVGQTAATIANIKQSPYGIVWANGLRVASEHPLLGVGPKNFRHACTCEGKQECPPDEVPCMLHPHNIYLEWAAETGLPGLAGFVFLIVLWFGKFKQALRQKPPLPIALGGWITVLIGLWPLSSTGSFFSNWYEVLFWLAASIALAATEKGVDREKARKLA